MLGEELLEARGWPAGTEALVDPTRRPARADVVVFRERGLLLAGIFHHQFGRPLVHNDRGVTWVGLGAEVIGVVVLVGPALDRMPHADEPVPAQLRGRRTAQLSSRS